MGSILDFILGIIPKALDLIKNMKKERLGTIEKEIIINAARSKGEIQKLSTDQTGDFIRAGKKDFINSEDNSVRITALDAFEKLKNRNYIIHNSGCIYRLTEEAYKKVNK